MRRLWVLIPAFVACLAALGGHYRLSGPGVAEDPTECTAPSVACAAVCPEEPAAADGYWKSGRAFLGLSYGLAAGFFVYVVAHALAQKGGVRSLLAGATLTGALWLGLCWLAGCCGSPLLPVYVSLFGARFLGVTSPLAFGLTAASVTVGVVWFHRTCGCRECPPGKEGP